MSEATQFVRDGLLACLPPGVPLMGQIIRVKFTSKQKAVATLSLFDGLQGTVEVSRYATHADAWKIWWLELAGGDINWNGSAWERIAPVRLQLSLFDGFDHEGGVNHGR